MSRSVIQDRCIFLLLCCLVLAVCVVFCWLLYDIVTQGYAELSWSLLVDVPSDAGRAGGIGSVLVSTLVVLLVCLVTALPLALGTAIWLAEFSGHGRANIACAASVRTCLHLLAGVPSIVIGLFGHAFFCQLLGFGYSLLAGGLTLACMVLPLLVGSLEAGLRAVPVHYRHHAAALALSQSATIRRVLIPQASPALIAGVILSIGRSLAETAALLFTSGYVTRMPESVFDSGRVLSVHVFDLAMNVPGGDQRAYSAALVLLISLFAINVVAKLSLAMLGGKSHA